MNKPLSLALAISLLLAAAAVGNEPFETATLTDVRQINEPGFGTDANKYAFSMAAFQDALYVGTLNIKSMVGMAAFGAALPAKGMSQGAEVWRYDGQTWEQVVAGGLGDACNLGVRKLMAIGGCLYGVTANHDHGMEVWRSCDGRDWEAVATHGFGDKKNTSGRGLGVFDGYIYVGTENRARGAQLWRSCDGLDWEKVADGGIIDQKNVWLSDMVEFKGLLYMGSLNFKTGMQLFRTRDGRHFERVFQGGLGDRKNRGAMKLIVFKDRLFLSTMNFKGGFDLFVSDDGLAFSPVMREGFISPHNVYLWQMVEFNGRLYGGTYNHRLPLPTGAFQLYSSADGEDWVVEDDAGFGQLWHYGVRTLAVFDGKLIVGSASPRYGTRVFAASAK